MKQHFISVALTAVALLLSAGLSVALENKADTPQQGTSKAEMTPKTAKSIDAKRKAHANINLVDINGATREQLKKLPGIGSADAGKIIAGRPYASKADLVTHNIIDIGVYENLKKWVVAKQPYKDGAKNAALYGKMK